VIKTTDKFIDKWHMQRLLDFHHKFAKNMKT
jgi:hypothetical protein